MGGGGDEEATTSVSVSSPPCLPLHIPTVVIYVHVIL
jgi:hypothetical protein